MNTNYTPLKQAKPKGYRLHRVPRRDHRDYETALAHAQGIYGKVHRASTARCAEQVGRVGATGSCTCRSRRDDG